jgi:outer membrane receptor protein involved in Fe transport
VLGTGESNPPPIAAGQTAAGAQSTRLICEALMGGPGSSGANQFYNLNNAPAATGGGFAWVLQKGNPNLVPETADTLTWGLVASLANNMTWSFDWYKVEVEDAIMLYSLTYAGWRCFGANQVTTPAEAAVAAATPGCQLVPRDLNNGAPLNAQLSYDNQATIKTSGMDVAWNWNRPLGAASLGFNLQATILDYYETKTRPHRLTSTDWAGSLGLTLTAQRRRVRLSIVRPVNYARPINVALRWVSAVRVHAQYAAAGDQGEQRPGVGRWVGHPAQLHADDGV